MLNRHQPPRPDKDAETGDKLFYRTYPHLRDGDERTYRVMEPANQLSQMQLYRWSRSDQFVSSPSIADLYDFLIAEPFGETRQIQYEGIVPKTVVSGKIPFFPSKHHFGRTITNALDYNPRKLKGQTKDNEKACQIYMFMNPLELQYGLEYMICSWLRKFLNDQIAPGAQVISGSEAMAEELDILNNSSWKDYLEVYVHPLQMNRNLYPEPDWRELLRRSNANEVVPELDSQEPRRKLKNFNTSQASE
jgi:hypothetical protein